MRDRVVDERPAVVLEEMLNEGRRFRWRHADDGLPQWGGRVTARHHHAPGSNADAPPEDRERTRMRAKLQQRLAIGPKPRERLVVERGPAVIEQRGTAIADDRRPAFGVGDLLRP